MEENWDNLEKSLRQLLGSVKKKLTPSEQREVLDFIESNELDAAMEALVDILMDKKEPLPRKTIDTAAKLAGDLGLPHEVKRISSSLTAQA